MLPLLVAGLIIKLIDDGQREARAKEQAQDAERERERRHAEQEQERNRAERERERKEAERERERQHAERERERKQAERERERKRDEEERERKRGEKERERRQAEEKRERMRAERERAWEAKQERLRQEARREREKQKADEERERRRAEEERRIKLANKERAWEAKQERKMQQAEEERVKHDKLKKMLSEGFERQKQAQKEAEEEQEKRFQNLQQDVERKLEEVNDIRNSVKQGIHMFLLFLRQREQSSHGPHCRCDQCRKQINGQYQNFAQILSPLELIEQLGNDEEKLGSNFNSPLLIEDKPRKAFDTASSSRFSNYTSELEVLELPEEIPEGFEDNVLNLLMTKINGRTRRKEEANIYIKDEEYDEDVVILDGTRGKEETNVYIRDKEYDEDVVILGETQMKTDRNVYSENQFVKDSIKYYSKSINESPTPAAYASRAMVYLQNNKLIEAEKDCTQALMMDNRYFKAYARRAMARKGMGRNLQGALKDVETALELKPNNADMKELRAKIRQVLG